MNLYNFSISRLLNSESPPKFGTERIKKIMAELNNPHDNYLIFHIAGTNGKGSTCAFLSSILIASGYRVGLYTSPHLSCIRERIQINGELISKKYFAKLEEKVSINGTFFERITAMAFLYFSEQKVDIAIIEVGLGGRLDATNIACPIAVGISKIGIDHQEILGNTIQKITFEKSGVIKFGVPAIWSKQDKSAEKILFKISRHKVNLNLNINVLKLGLLGNFQLENASLAIQLIMISDLQTAQTYIDHGFKTVKWPCRFDLVKSNILIDGAHNPLGIKILIKALKQAGFNPKFIWIGLTKGHDGPLMAKMLYRAFPSANIFAGKSNSKRAYSSSEVKKIFKETGFLNVDKISSNKIANTLFSSKESATYGFNLVTGSLYWGGLVRSIIMKHSFEKYKILY